MSQTCSIKIAKVRELGARLMKPRIPYVFASTATEAAPEGQARLLLFCYYNHYYPRSAMCLFVCPRGSLQAKIRQARQGSTGYSFWCYIFATNSKIQGKNTEEREYKMVWNLPLSKP